MNDLELRLFVIATLTAAANALAIGGKADRVAEEKMLMLTPTFEALAALDSFGKDAQ